jgi:hypothetical protein
MHATRKQGSSRRKWLRRIALLFVLLLAANAALSWLVSRGRVQRALAARLTAAFGRPVDVSNFEIGFLGGVKLVANYVTVSEDPRFGYEYFIRADRLSAGLRWSSLLRGRLEFDSLSFTRPSLNLVRNPDGDWNLESWFPQRRREGGLASSATAAPPAEAGRFTRISIDAGRINFKRGVEKHPFAFVNLDGFMERAADGSWRLDLEASMMRAGASLQEPGTLRLRGRFGSPEDRVRPAALTLSWRDASLSDLLRLARGYDYGVRGALEMELSASAPAVSQQLWAWSVNLGLRLTDVHGWNLPRRDFDPDINLAVDARWTPRPARLDFDKILLEAPRSNVRASGFVQWARPQASRFYLRSAGISLEDLLDWLRAFRPGVAPDLQVEGSVGLDAELGGWPTVVTRAVLAVDRAELRLPAIRDPLRIGRAVLRCKDGKIEFPAAPIAFAPLSLRGGPPAGPAGGELTLRGTGKILPPSRCGAWLCGDFAFVLAGATHRLQNYASLSRALALDFTHGWAVDGPARFSLAWHANFSPFLVQSSGFVQFLGTRLQPPFLNLPVILTDVRLSWQPALPLLFSPLPGSDAKAGERLLKLNRADVFGAHWSGSLSSKGAGPWEFSLSADRLEVAAVNQWMNPRQQPGLFQRLIAPARPQRGSAEYEEQLGRLRARGRIAVGELVLAPVVFRKLRGALSLDARTLTLASAEAEFHGGTAWGSFRAELSAQPVYRAEAKFTIVNIADLTAGTMSHQNQLAGAASGEISLTARGITRADLTESLEGEGKIEASDASWRSLDLRSSLDAGSVRPGISRFSSATGSFTFARRKLQLPGLKLTDRFGALEARGSVAFPADLDLTFKPFTAQAYRTKPGSLARIAPSARGEVRLTGTLSAPRIAPAEPPKKP